MNKQTLERQEEIYDNALLDSAEKVSKRLIIPVIFGESGSRVDQSQLVTKYLAAVTKLSDEPAEIADKTKPIEYRVLKFLLPSITREAGFGKPIIKNKLIILKDIQGKKAKVYYAPFTAKEEKSGSVASPQMEQLPDTAVLVPQILEPGELDFTIDLEVVLPEELQMFAPMIPTTEEGELINGFRIKPLVLPIKAQQINQIQKLCWESRSKAAINIDRQNEQVLPNEELLSMGIIKYEEQTENKDRPIYKLVRGNEKRIAEYILNTARTYKSRDLEEAKGYLFEALVDIMMGTEEFKTKLRSWLRNESLQIDSDLTKNIAHLYQTFMQENKFRHSDMLFLEKNSESSIRDINVACLVECKIATSDNFDPEHQRQIKDSAFLINRFVKWVNGIPLVNGQRINLGKKLNMIDAHSLPLVVIKLAGEGEGKYLEHQAVFMGGFNYHLIRTDITISEINELWNSITSHNQQ